MLRAGCAVLFVLGLLWTPLAAEDRRVDFNRDIRPLLSNTCYKCHGPDEAERKGGLRLDLKDEALKTLESGTAALVPGKLDESELYRRLITDDASEKMPPKSSGKTLTPEQIALFKTWIEQGAEWREHWSFVTPTRPAVPQVSEADVRNPIDAFIRTRLAKEGLTPAPEADRQTLIRRVTLDLTGLPPTPAEVDAFLAHEAPGAYERVVDRLLKSPRYGEHMARYWLDAARYGDTHGLHLDNERGIWPYRDWVIGAFNRNLPFDQFTIEQLAGDQLPNATLEQKLATGFVRCNVTTGEGGSIDEEFYVRYAVDRVETMGTVWMGLTLGCAVCHNHKYDAVTMKDFYSLYAFFNSLTERAMDGNVIGPPPVVKVTTPEQQKQLDAFFDQTLAFDARIREELAKVSYTDPLQGQAVTTPERADFVWIEDDFPKGAQPSGNTPWEWVTADTKPVYSGQRASTRTATGLSQHFFEHAQAVLRIGDGDKLFAYVYLDPKNPPKEIMLQWNDGSWNHRAYWGENMIDWGGNDSPSRRNMGALPKTGEWVRLEVSAEHVGLKAGAVVKGWAFTQFDGTTYWDKAGLNTVTPQEGGSFESLLAWEALQKAIKDTTLPKAVQEALAVEAAKRTPEQQKSLVDYFVEHVYAKTKPTFDDLHAQRKKVQDQLAELDKQVPTSMILEDMPQPKEAFVLVRGQYDQKGEKVTPGTPASLPPMKLAEGQPLNRLALAKWLVQPDHPLTARVAVNRYWQQYFGTGLVETSEDFGAQGQWPSHPELLDWLATEFIASGWDVKHLQRLIVTSATYRQSSKVTPESAQKDAANRLLSRGPRFRLDAEVIRDTALFTGGLLVEKVGGRSVKPYQPSGLWEAIGFTGSNTANFVQDHGEALYRRSVYTFWKRTSPPPSLSIFDAPSREACVVRRSRTNTPMHALVLMNDVQFVEASRAFGQRILKDGGDSLDAKLAYAFRTVVARSPKPDELAVLTRVWQQHLADFQADPEAAKKLVSAGEAPRDESLPVAEHAAWTMIANLMLNLSEAVTKG